MTFRTTLLALGLTAAVAGGAWMTPTVTAQSRQKPAAGARREGHPVLLNSIRQIEGIKDRLQKAPSDFGGHRAAAIEALNHAVNELNQAIQYDKK
jgi:hypothetical protein